MIEYYIRQIILLLNELGYQGVFIAMLLAGFCAPIPWELVLIPAGASSLDPFVTSIVGGLGSSTGAILGYILGLKIGRPEILKYGRYLLVDQESLLRAERWIQRWGYLATIFFRSVQYMPYKSYNIAAGVLRMDLFSYTVLTLTGSVIRCLSLVYIGKIAVIDLSLLFLVLACSFLISIVIFVHKLIERRKMVWTVRIIA
ncbi:MAG TPA: hypothetical protein ENF42_02655 [Candidatus Bathyarchaeota archaeon]|nr:hypothetical protein [Candidatus Bathyarchaeota archaeon]